VAEKRVPQRAAHGHMIVASPYKMFASEDGGMLWANPGSASTAPRSLADELRGLRAVWERRARKAPPALALPAPGARGADEAEPGLRPSVQYHLELEGKQSLASSRWIVRHTPSGPMREKRRANYRQWQDALAGNAGARALFEALPADCAPYMFALLVERPDPVFFQLKQAGMPIWRWDEMAISGCPVATRYRLGVLHLPCHQDLDPAQMAWMTALVRKALA
jgi:perosamine synthetase